MAALITGRFPSQTTSGDVTVSATAQEVATIPSPLPDSLPLIPTLAVSDASDFVGSTDFESIGAPVISIPQPTATANFYGGGGGIGDNYLDPGATAAHLKPTTRIFGPTGAVK